MGGPGLIVFRLRPEAIRFGPTPFGVELRGGRLVRKQLGRSFKIRPESTGDGPKRKRVSSQPFGPCGAVDLNALTRPDMGLAIGRVIVGIFSDGFIGKRRVRWKADRDDVLLCRGFDDARIP